MKTKTKIWLGVGAFVIAGSGSAPGICPLLAETASSVNIPSSAAQGHAGHQSVFAQMDHAPKAAEGGEQGSVDNLPPDLKFGVSIGQLRGHLLVGDQLVKDGEWDGAFPHFLHPTEEIYNNIRDRLSELKVPPFDTALKALAKAVEEKNSSDYAHALKPVHDSLSAAENALKATQQDWTSFRTEAAVELAKSATGEYGEAIVDGHIVKPVEYQDARGFIWQSEIMIEGAAPALETKNGAALKAVRAGYADLKKAFPTTVPPSTPVKTPDAVNADVTRIELAAGPLM